MLVFLISFFVVLGIFSMIGLGSISLQGEAMTPGYEDGDRLLYSPYPYGVAIAGRRYLTISLPNRGDIVLIRPAYNAEIAWWRSGVDAFIRIISFQQLELGDLIGSGQGDPWLVRRLVGLPGDTLYIDKGWCFINPPGESGFIREDQLSAKGYTIQPAPPIPGWEDRFPGPASLAPRTLGDDEYFVLSDNRALADDSRIWGPLSSRAILSRILVRYWPLPGREK